MSLIACIFSVASYASFPERCEDALAAALSLVKLRNAAIFSWLIHKWFIPPENYIISWLIKIQRALIKIIFVKRASASRWRIERKIWYMRLSSAPRVKSWGLKAESWKLRNFTIENFQWVNAPNNLPRRILVALREAPGHPISFPCSIVPQVTGPAFQKREKNERVRARVCMRMCVTERNFDSCICALTCRGNSPNDRRLSRVTRKPHQTERRRKNLKFMY